MRTPAWGRRARGALARDLAAAARLLTARGERRRLAQELRGGGLAPERVHALVLLAAFAGLAAWVAGTLALRALAPGALGVWDAGWGMAAVAFATTAGVPGSYVVPLLLVRGAGAQAAAVLGAACGMAAGALVAHGIGGAARRKLEAWERCGRWAKAFLRWTEGAVRRWGYGALAVFLAVPGLPDSIPIYVFSVVGLRMGPFLAAAFVGSLARSAITLLAGMQALRLLGWA